MAGAKKKKEEYNDEEGNKRNQHVLHPTVINCLSDTAHLTAHSQLPDQVPLHTACPLAGHWKGEIRHRDKGKLTQRKDLSNFKV